MFAPTTSVHKVGSRLLELLYKLAASGSRSVTVVKKILISVHFVYENTCVRVCVGGGGGADFAGSI